MFERFFLLSLHSSHGGDRVPLITKQHSPPNKGEGADSRACAVLITSAASPSELAGEPGLDVHSRTQVRREALTPKHEAFIQQTGCYRRRSGRVGGWGRLLLCGALNIDPSARAKETGLHANCGCGLRAALFPLYLNVARPLLWPSASFTPGWLNVPLGGWWGWGG